jgi:hypothetical protein
MAANKISGGQIDQDQADDAGPDQVARPKNIA